MEDSEEEDEEEEDVSEDDEAEELAGDEQRNGPTKPQQLALARGYNEPRHVLYQEPPSPPVCMAQDGLEHISAANPIYDGHVVA